MRDKLNVSKVQDSMQSFSLTKQQSTPCVQKHQIVHLVTFKASFYSPYQLD